MRTAKLTLAAVLTASLCFAACDKEANKGGATAEKVKAEANKTVDKAKAKADEAKAAAEAKIADAKKAAEAAKAKAKAATGKVKAVAGAAAGAAPAAGDYIKFVIDHTDSKKGLVNGSFSKFSVVEANINASDLTKSTATIKVDITSIDTGNGARDKHLKSPDFFDVAKWGQALITVNEIKKTDAADVFTANAWLDLHGAKKKLPVGFKVLSNKDGTVVIEGATKGIKRADWGVGGPPDKSGAAATFDASVRLTLKNTKK